MQLQDFCGHFAKETTVFITSDGEEYVINIYLQFKMSHFLSKSKQFLRGRIAEVPSAVLYTY